jgi:hypothetical protein
MNIYVKREIIMLMQNFIVEVFFTHMIIMMRSSPKFVNFLHAKLIYISPIEPVLFMIQMGMILLVRKVIGSLMIRELLFLTALGLLYHCPV